MEERIISSLSLASLSDEVIASENKSYDQSESSVIVDSSSQTDQDVMQDSKTDVLANVTVNSEQAVYQSETVSEEPESLTNNTEEGDLNKNDGDNKTREETMRTSQTEGEAETSTDIERSEPSAMITEEESCDGGGAEELPTLPEGNSGQMLKVIVPKHLLPAIKQISLPSVLLSRCKSSEPVPLK